MRSLCYMRAAPTVLCFYQLSVDLNLLGCPDLACQGGPMGLRFNPPPGWPIPPEGFTPGPGWQPDPAWPAAPPGWQLWVDDAQPTVSAQAPQQSPGQAWQAPGQGWQAPQPGQYPATGYPMTGPYPGQPMGQPAGTNGWAVAAFI